MSVEKAAAFPFPSQALVPHPFRLSAAAAVGGGAHSLRTRRARRRGGRRRRVLRGGGGGEEAADWGSWTHKESWARASATGNGHRDQARMHTGLARCPRAQRGNGAQFLGWVAAAAAVPFVVPTRPPSHGSIAAPIPRSPASGDARRRGFGLSACWRRGARGAPTAAAGTHACHRSRNSTHSAPLLRLDREAPLSTFAVPAGPQRSSFVSATCGGAGGCSRSGGGGAGGGWTLAESLWLPSPGRSSLPTRVVEAHGALSLCHPAAASPPTPPFGSRRLRCQGRRPAQGTPSLPI